ncbi:MAG: amino acid ABC transporter permease [Clostridia bacterium]|nr:amino acid ABC transporter permease [Clostridia bacterium]MDY5263563.1 amino acid ABC transporter permease [Eubacteriales bacterium]
MFAQVTQDLFSGFGTTLLLFAITLVMALPLGLLVSFCSASKFKPLSFISKTIVWIFRGTPLILQIVVITFVPNYIFKVPNMKLAEALNVSITQLNFIYVAVAFVLNYAAYFSEIYRGGIQSINKGQYEAGQVLGMTKTQIFFRVVLLQVIKRIIPPMSNEIITLVKDTSLARVLGIMELIMVAEDAVNRLVEVWPIFYVGVFYLAFVGLLTLLFNWLEKRLSYFN